MKACLVAYRVYEVSTHMMQFANALARRGDEIDVVCVGFEGAKRHEIVEGVHVWRLQCRRLSDSSATKYVLRVVAFLVQAAWFIAVRHFSQPYRLVHVQSVPDFLVFAACVPKLLGTPVILDFRDLVPEFYATRFGTSSKSLLFRLLVWSERLSAAFADRVLVANPIWYERIVNRSAKMCKCTEFWYEPDPTIFYPRRKRRADGAFRMMFPGNFNWHQGLDFAIESFPGILKEVPEAEMHLYGDGPAKSGLTELTGQLALQDKVKFFDPVPVDQIAQAMADSDLGIVTKRASSPFGNEAASTKIFEFMSLGVPVVVSRTDIDQRFFDDSLVQFFRSDDKQAFVKAVLAVRRDPELRERMVSSGLRYMKEGSRRANIADYLCLVDALTGRKGSVLPQGSRRVAQG